MSTNLGYLGFGFKGVGRYTDYRSAPAPTSSTSQSRSTEIFDRALADHFNYQKSSKTKFYQRFLECVDLHNAHNSGQPWVLVLVAPFDFNGALTNEHSQILILQIAQRYRVNIQFIRDKNNIQFAIRSLPPGEPLAGVYVIAHSGPSRICISGNETREQWISLKDDRVDEGILTILSERIVPHGDFWIYGCEAGKGEECVAQKIANLIGRRVFASTILINCFSCISYCDRHAGRMELATVSDKNPFRSSTLEFRKGCQPALPCFPDRYAILHNESYVSAKAEFEEYCNQDRGTGYLSATFCQLGFDLLRIDEFDHAQRYFKKAADLGSCEAKQMVDNDRVQEIRALPSYTQRICYTQIS